jgi:hypothetical protein
MSEDRKEEGRGFKVVDRRYLDAEGNPRDPEAAEQPAEPAKEPDRKRPGAQGGPAPGGAAPGGSEPRDEAEPSAYYLGEAPDAGALDFPQFILSLAQLAFAFLGDLPNPQTGRRERNVAAAQQQIDLLGLLREKTRGNLTPDEDQLLNTLLYELHRRYVEVVEQKPTTANRD